MGVKNKINRLIDWLKKKDRKDSLNMAVHRKKKWRKDELFLQICLVGLLLLSLWSGSNFGLGLSVAGIVFGAIRYLDYRAIEKTGFMAEFLAQRSRHDISPKEIDHKANWDKLGVENET